MHRLFRVPALCLALCVPLASNAEAQTIYPDGWGFQWQLGISQTSGGWADAVDAGVDADINIFYNLRNFRIGGGGNFVSYDLVEPIPDIFESIASVELHGFFGYHFLRGPVQPYIQGKGTWVRLRPEGYHPVFVPPEEGEEEEEEGENTAPKRDGFGFGIVGGVEWRITYSVGLEAMLNWHSFSVNEVDLTPLGIPSTFDSGSNWGGRVGINWYP